MNNKISIIVPIYNVEKYLAKCLDSIINQTYKNLEIILVDDGSPDRCGIICDEYSLMDTRIKVIHKKNSGVADARNSGLNAATGAYIGFIDPDDYVQKDYYKTLKNLIDEHDADIAQCCFLKIYDENMQIAHENTSQVSETIKELDGIEALNNLFNKNYVNTVVLWNKLYKRNLFENVRFPSGKVHEDDLVTYKVLFSAQKIVTTSEKLYYYLQHPNSITGKTFNIKNLDALQAHSEQIIFYGNKKLFDLEKKAKIRLERHTRKSLCKIVQCNLNEKKEIFTNLLSYYRRNYDFFSNNINPNLRKKITMLLFKYAPESFLRLLCLFIYRF